MIVHVVVDRRHHHDAHSHHEQQRKHHRLENVDVEEIRLVDEHHRRRNTTKRLCGCETKRRVSHSFIFAESGASLFSSPRYVMWGPIVVVFICWGLVYKLHPNTTTVYVQIKNGRLVVNKRIDNDAYIFSAIDVAFDKRYAYGLFSLPLLTLFVPEDYRVEIFFLLFISAYMVSWTNIMFKNNIVDVQIDQVAMLPAVMHRVQESVEYYQRCLVRIRSQENIERILSHEENQIRRSATRAEKEWRQLRAVYEPERRKTILVACEFLQQFVCQNLNELL